MTALRRLRYLSASDRRLTLEAALILALAALCVALLPFRTLAKLASQPPRSAPTEPPAETIKAVRNAVIRSARRMPFRAKCFEQGLAAVWMLRRRGVVTALHYGMTKLDGIFVSHVWVTVGERGVIGCENRDEFRELARFPSR